MIPAKHAIDGLCELVVVALVDANCDYAADLAGAINSMYQCKLYQQWCRHGSERSLHATCNFFFHFVIFIPPVISLDPVSADCQGSEIEHVMLWLCRRLVLAWQR
jgi:hypothetical protein